MSRKAIHVSVDFDVHAVTCPGVWLCPKGTVMLRIAMFGLSESTKTVKPCFPLLFHERFRFRKLLKSVNSLSCLQEVLKCRNLHMQLVHLAAGPNCCPATVLATFKSPLCDVFYPSPADRGLNSGVDVDLLLTPTSSFPGIISPKVEVSTRVVIEEVVNFTSPDEDQWIVNPVTVTSKKDLQKPADVYSAPAIRQRPVCHTEETGCIDTNGCKCYAEKREHDRRPVFRTGKSKKTGSTHEKKKSSGCFKTRPKDRKVKVVKENKKPLLCQCCSENTSDSEKSSPARIEDVDSDEKPVVRKEKHRRKRHQRVSHQRASYNPKPCECITLKKSSSSSTCNCAHCKQYHEYFAEHSSEASSNTSDELSTESTRSSDTSMVSHKSKQKKENEMKKLEKRRKQKRDKEQKKLERKLAKEKQKQKHSKGRKESKSCGKKHKAKRHSKGHQDENVCVNCGCRCEPVERPSPGPEPVHNISPREQPRTQYEGQRIPDEGCKCVVEPKTEVLLKPKQPCKVGCRCANARRMNEVNHDVTGNNNGHRVGCKCGIYSCQEWQRNKACSFLPTLNQNSDVNDSKCVVPQHTTHRQIFYANLEEYYRKLYDRAKERSAIEQVGACA